MNERSKTLGIALLAAGFYAGAFGIRVSALDANAIARSGAASEEETKVTSPGKDALRIAAFEHPFAIADAVWLDIVQVIGRSIKDPRWDRVERWAWIAVDLDPKYYTVYHATAVNLSVFGRRPNASDALCERGAQELPDRWEFPFLLGYNAYFWRADFAKGFEHINKAASFPKAPSYLHALAARMRFQGGDEAGALEFLENLIKVLKGPEQNNARQRLKAFRSEFRMRRFDEACERMVKEKGRFPMDGQDLVDSGLISEPAVDDYGSPILFPTLNTCTCKTSTMIVRETEAKSYAGKERRFAARTSTTTTPENE